MGGGDEVSADCEDDDTDTESETTAAPQSKVQPIPENTPLEILTGIIAAASVAASTAAMIIQPTNLVFAAGGLSWYVLSIICKVHNPLPARAKYPNLIMPENIHHHRPLSVLFGGKCNWSIRLLSTEAAYGYSCYAGN